MQIKVNYRDNRQDLTVKTERNIFVYAYDGYSDEEQSVPLYMAILSRSGSCYYIKPEYQGNNSGYSLI